MPDVLKERCACEICCNGEHLGSCRECAGWGDRIEDEGIIPCAWCDGTGVCPECNGDAAKHNADLERRAAQPFGGSERLAGEGA